MMSLAMVVMAGCGMHGEEAFGKIEYKIPTEWVQEGEFPDVRYTYEDGSVGIHQSNDLYGLGEDSEKAFERLNEENENNIEGYELEYGMNGSTTYGQNYIEVKFADARGEEHREIIIEDSGTIYYVDFHGTLESKEIDKIIESLGIK
jgi:hypothetical protein